MSRHGGTVSRKTAYKNTTKLCWRIMILLEPKKWRGTTKNFRRFAPDRCPQFHIRFSATGYKRRKLWNWFHGTNTHTHTHTHTGVTTRQLPAICYVQGTNVQNGRLQTFTHTTKLICLRNCPSFRLSERSKQTGFAGSPSVFQIACASWVGYYGINSSFSFSHKTYCKAKTVRRQKCTVV